MDKAERDREAQRPLSEAGQGESEGFEAAEAELIDHASHGDYRDAGHIIGDAEHGAEDPRAADTESGEADFERSSEVRDGASGDL